MTIDTSGEDGHSLSRIHTFFDISRSSISDTPPHQNHTLEQTYRDCHNLKRSDSPSAPCPKTPGNPTLSFRNPLWTTANPPDQVRRQSLRPSIPSPRTQHQFRHKHYPTTSFDPSPPYLLPTQVEMMPREEPQSHSSARNAKSQPHPFHLIWAGLYPLRTGSLTQLGR